MNNTVKVEEARRMLEKLVKYRKKTKLTLGKVIKLFPTDTSQFIFV